MRGKLPYIILFVIIAVLGIALAVVSIFYFVASNPPVEEGDAIETTVVEPANLVEYSPYTTSDNPVFNLKKTEANPNSFIMASVSIIYDSGEKKKIQEERTEIVQVKYLSQLKQAVIEYFLGKSYEDLTAEGAMATARDDLKQIFNEIIGSTPRDQFIYQIVFDKWIIQSQ